MTLAWFFDLEAVCQQRLFMDEFRCATDTDAIHEIMRQCRVRAGLETAGGWYTGPRLYRPMFPPTD
jgi:hypothetical protein